MLTLRPSIRIFVCLRPADMRKSLDGLSAMARERLNALRETNDGFEIAEKDLKLRGPGELLGTRQTGRLEFRIANLTRDAAMLAEVQDVAGTMLRKHAGACDRLIARWVGNSARFADA